ncbi:substrate-binding domain-containing protein [Paenibacillus sp. p3-SID1389]|uniref:GntR family transcriptional regulator n=1 Tax=Paenibacillus sp. p3-SID1389 TaxID=2916364 RepID=UPI0021A33D44|nr:substrate-binding domain-containing protein [Paenibacillus sp. p3-SID1389]MCT2194479.1 substrate-binding domain-containing protein [Paenibacillus sp. p3-SID1389]
MSETTSSKPMYEKIFDDVKQKILDHSYKPGDRIPSEKELAEEYQVSRITSKRALEMLAAEGIIVRKPGRGSFVTDPEAEGTGAEEQANGRWDGIYSGNRTAKEAAGKLIGVVLTDFAGSYGTRLIYGMEDAAREQDCFLVLKRTFGVQENEEATIRKLLQLGVDGLIVFPAQGEYFNAEILKLVIERFPLVLIDRELKGVAAASIITDNVKAAQEAAEHLFDLGHARISLLSPPPIDTSAVEERIEGFVQAHAGRGIAVERELWISDLTSTLPNSFYDDNIERDIQKIMRHLEAHPTISAFFAIEYNIALLAKAAVTRLGLRIPEDVSIICFDSPQFRIGEGYAFTHMRQSEEDMGKLAVENVLALMENRLVANKIKLPAVLVPGESTGPAREERERK